MRGAPTDDQPGFAAEERGTDTAASGSFASVKPTS